MLEILMLKLKIKLLWNFSDLPTLVEMDLLWLISQELSKKLKFWRSIEVEWTLSSIWAYPMMLWLPLRKVNWSAIIVVETITMRLLSVKSKVSILNHLPLWMVIASTVDQEISQNKLTLKTLNKFSKTIRNKRMSS